jgi:ADP-ribose pyrophosphatase YjhB (NUDIX family)
MTHIVTKTTKPTMNLCDFLKQSQEPSKVKLTSKPKCIGAGAFILNLLTLEVLVVRGPVKWSLPKGHLEPGEEPSEGSEREIFEETSLKIKIGREARSKKIRKYIYYYIILDNAKELELTPLDVNEVQELKWCTQEDLKKLDCNKQLKYFIDNWSQIIKIFVENQEELTQTGQTPSFDEKTQLIAQIKNEHQLYNSFGSFRDPIGPKKLELEVESD